MKLLASLCNILKKIKNIESYHIESGNPEAQNVKPIQQIREIDWFQRRGVAWCKPKNEDSFQDNIETTGTKQELILKTHDSELK